PIPPATTIPAAATPTPQIGISLATIAPPTAVLHQTTPTPLPTPTATPTATPIIYQIQSGDTLLDIAILQNTTVAQIEAMNPGIQADLLQIGQAIQLPPPATPLAQAVRGTAVPVQLTVTQIQVVQTPVGSVWALGELRNDGELAVENAQVELSFRGADGIVQETAVSWAAATLILPGQTSPFGTLLADASAELGQPVVSVIGGQTVIDLGSRYVDVVVGETAVSLQGDQLQIIGTLHNTGTEIAAQITLVAAIYDADDRLIGYQQTNLSQPVSPGDTLAFELDAAPPGGRAKTAVITVTANRAELE
ncbi:MAG: LysM peptidoglycan-binding domain-containing protein, partial [Chloroflexi bacterium]|nr:LysM peptidoglycan-binding domain-containing protein [Chloroflexota bacterium]